MTIRGDLDLVARTEHLFSSIREEFLCAVDDLSTWSHLAGGRAPDGGSHRVRKLCGAAALADERDRAHLRALVAGGAHVRIAATALPHETIIIDRRFAILAGVVTPGGREYTVTTGPALVGAVYALLEAAWATATDLEVFLRGEQPHLDARSRSVLRALGSGVTDEAAARELGMSLRTYRRRVAELLAALGADSRFQAGVRAGELGLNAEGARP
ncbi:DNA-binding response regulator [Streptomyces sp. 8K308]|nr:DNA-binding response regulator [Streptomyces sp. 8K308]